MSCCAPGAESGLEYGPAISREEAVLASRDLGNGRMQTVINVPDAHCGACIAKVEKAMGSVSGIDTARLNLSTRRLTVTWRRDATDPTLFAGALAAAGYSSFLADPAETGADPALRELLVSLGVAGFAAGNIMLLSVSVWSGAEGATRDLFHWISALIALPTIAFSGRVFFRPAWAALRAGRLNMDVPISLAVLLAAAMSVYETANHGESAYFDAAVTLLFFLLIGRTLDHVMRERARSAVRSLARLAPRGAVVLAPDGEHAFRPISEIEPGMRLRIAAGERVPVDALVRSGASEFDFSLVNGEGQPVAARDGLSLPAGVLNLSGPVEIEATARADDSFVAEMVRLMETAESSRTGFRRLSDRAADIYAPAVHLLALATFLFWLAMGAGWHYAAFTAIAVLVITCPCALGLAVPIVQVVAAGRLFRQGVMVKSGTALERLAEVDCAVFDKTGTLTAGRPRLIVDGQVAADDLALAASLARGSRHPYSRAIAAACAERPQMALEAVRESPGHGLEGEIAGHKVRLGQPGWACPSSAGPTGGVALSVDGVLRARFDFEDPIRQGARAALDRLRDIGIGGEILSGDDAGRVAAVARELGVAEYHSRLTPGAKLERLNALGGQGRHPLMVGDGINDAPALAAAHVSFAPSTAADIGRNAADFIFLHDDLRAVPGALEVARRAKRLILENFGLAIAYNVVAVPLAVAGYATPLVAALAMSSSSILVTLNALRLNLGATADQPRPAGTRRSGTAGPVATAMHGTTS